MEKDFFKRFTRSMRARQRALRMSREELASKASLSEGYIRLIEEGGCALDLRTAARIADALGTTVGEMTGE